MVSGHSKSKVTTPSDLTLTMHRYFFSLQKNPVLDCNIHVWVMPDTYVTNGGPIIVLPLLISDIFQYSTRKI